MPGRGRIPIWIKIVYAAFVGVLVPVYWHHYGPTNFLWASDLALFLLLVAAWWERPLLPSMMAIGVMPFEIVWTVDLLTGGPIGMASYMFEPERPPILKGLSLFHAMLPVIILFLLHRLGYDRRALVAQTLLIWVVLPLSYLVTDPADNINRVFGLGDEPQTLVHPLVYLAAQMIVVPLAICWPTHVVMKRCFGGPLPGSAERPAGPGPG